MPPQSMDAFLSRIDVDRTELTALHYRGRGCPGPTRVETAHATKEYHYLDFWGDDESAWQLPWRCKICPDGIGEAADIAASDTWPGGSPTRTDSVRDPGVNGVIARTEAGLELLEAAAQAGAIHIERDIAPDDMSLYQPHQVRKKYTVYDRYRGLHDEGRIAPQTARLRIAELAAERPEHDRTQQREGTRQRVRANKACEPTPKISDPS